MKIDFNEGFYRLFCILTPIVTCISFVYFNDNIGESQFVIALLSVLIGFIFYISFFAFEWIGSGFFKVEKQSEKFINKVFNKIKPCKVLHLYFILTILFVSVLGSFCSYKYYKNEYKDNLGRLYYLESYTHEIETENEKLKEQIKNLEDEIQHLSVKKSFEEIGIKVGKYPSFTKDTDKPSKYFQQYK